MKVMTCRQMGGACEKELRAETFEEMMELSKAHGMEMFQAQDIAHLAVVQQVIELMQNPANMAMYIAEKQRLFEQAPDSV